MPVLKRKSSTLTLISVLLLILIISGGFFVLYLTNTISLDAETINELGIVRGSSQRLVKLELAGVGNDKLIKNTKSKIDKFSQDEIKLYGSKEEIKKTKKTRKDLGIIWSDLEKAIFDYRDNPSTRNEESLIEISEEIWDKSNEIVLMSQLSSEVKIKRYRISLVFFGVDIILAVIIIFLIRRYVKNTLEHLVDYDGLTNIFNKRYFNESLDMEIIKAEKHNKDLSLIILDIDYFKKINDSYGHDVGDIILKEISELIKSNLEKDNILSRIGGEEFAIIAPSTDRDQAFELAEKIRKSVEEYDFSYPKKKTTISIGISEYTQKDNKILLFKRADISLYKAKHNGRNRVC